MDFLVPNSMNLTPLLGPVEMYNSKCKPMILMKDDGLKDYEVVLP